MKILVADNSKLIRKIILEELKTNGYEILEAENASQVYSILDQNQISLVTLGVEMSGESGYEICKKILDKRWNDPLQKNKRMPVVFITSNDTLEGRKKGFEAGATDFITKPFREKQILHLVNKLLNPDETLKGTRALVIDDSKLDKKIISGCLQEQGVETIEASDGLEGFEILKNNTDRIDMVISDFIMPKMMGNELCQKIRNELMLKELPLIVLSGLTESMSILDIFRSGATDYIIKPFIKEELLARLTIHLKSVQLNKQLKENIIALKDMNKTLKHMAMTDPLTKVANRRYFFSRFKKEYQEMEKNRKEISFIIMDIDNFKKINDTYGHQVGDIVLIRLAKLIHKSGNGQRLVGRLGGEEFAVLLPDPENNEMEMLAEKIRADIEKWDFSTENNSGLKNVTVSVGVHTAVPSLKDTIDSIFKKADDNLYQAKHSGKNKVIAS